MDKLRLLIALVFFVFGMVFLAGNIYANGDVAVAARATWTCTPVLSSYINGVYTKSECHPPTYSLREAAVTYLDEDILKPANISSKPDDNLYLRRDITAAMLKKKRISLKNIISTEKNNRKRTIIFDTSRISPPETGSGGTNGNTTR